MMRRAPTKGDQVMSDNTGGGVIVPRSAGPPHSVGGLRRGATRLRSSIGLTQARGASSRPPLRPDEEQQHAERDAVDVVLREPALDPPRSEEHTSELQSLAYL